MKNEMRLAGSLAVVFSMAFAKIGFAQTTSPEAPDLVAARARFEQEIRAANGPVKMRYAQTLDALKKALFLRNDAAGVLAVQHEFERLGLLQNRPPGFFKEARVVIWNQHNNVFNDRGTNTINVALITGGKEVWRQTNIHVPWASGQDTKVEIDVPRIPTDKLRVEVMDSVNNQGGLAEIEYWWEGRNLAKGRKVEVSAVWENNIKHTGVTLTDGITTSKADAGYWLIPDRQTGWAEVALDIHD